MRIAFVFAPYSHKTFSENLRVVDEDFGTFPPINLAYAAAIAENAGHEVILIDANVLKLTKKQAIDQLREFAPEIVGFYFSTYMFHDTLGWVRDIKAELGVTILAGGINVGLFPDETMSHPIIDFGVQGHALNALPRLIEAIKEKRDPDDIPGVCWRKDGKVIINALDNKKIKFEEFPFPARHLLPNEKYFSYTSQLRNFTIMVTAMGCSHNCTFCAIAKIPISHRTAKQVVDEIEECVNKYDVKEIDIFDANFPFPRKRTLAICQGIVERGIDIEWSCRARIDSVDPELLDWMAKAGCKKIYYGIESPDEKKLNKVNKQLHPDDVEGVIQATQKAGIRALGFFMIGLPGETRASILRTIRFAISLNLDFAQFCRVIRKPRTEMDAEYVAKTGDDYWSHWVSGCESERRIGSEWTELSEKEIEFWTRVAYYSFYYRPRHILKTASKVRSVGEFVRMGRTARRMVLSLIQSDIGKTGK